MKKTTTTPTNDKKFCLKIYIFFDRNNIKSLPRISRRSIWVFPV